MNVTLVEVRCYYETFILKVLFDTEAPLSCVIVFLYPAQGTVCFYALEEQDTSLKPLKTSGQSFSCVRSDRMNTPQNMLHMQPEDSELQSSYGVMSVAAEVSVGRY